WLDVVLVLSSILVRRNPSVRYCAKIGNNSVDFGHSRLSPGPRLNSASTRDGSGKSSTFGDAGRCRAKQVLSVSEDQDVKSLSVLNAWGREAAALAAVLIMKLLIGRARNGMT